MSGNNSNQIKIQPSDNCSFYSKKLKVDNIYSQLDDYYLELRERLIDLVNKNAFEEDIEFFIIKMFKLDDKDDSDFNVISFIEEMKSLNDELYLNHKIACGADTVHKLLSKIDKLNDKIKHLQEDNEVYKAKLDKIEADLARTNSKASKIEFDCLNINYNNQPYFNADRLFLNDLMASQQGNSIQNHNSSQREVHMSAKSNIKTGSVLSGNKSKSNFNTIDNTNSNTKNNQYSSNNLNSYSAQQSNNTNLSTNKNQYITSLHSNYKKLSFGGKNQGDSKANNMTNSMMLSLNKNSTFNNARNKDKNISLYSGNSDLMTSKMMIDQLYSTSTAKTQRANNNLLSSKSNHSRDISGNSKVIRKVRFNN